jgi:hypothetical protein
MLRVRTIVFAALLALLGCDLRMLDLKPGVSTAAEVKRAMGQPTYEWKEPDGSLTWEFPRGPTGVVTYMVTIRPDGILKEIRQVLTQAYFAQIRPGMTQDEIRRLIGKPGETMTFPLKKEEVWTWRYEPATGERWHFHVHFDLAGRVLTTSANQVDTPP